MDISFSSKNPLTRFVYIILAAHILKKKKTSLVFSSKEKLKAQKYLQRMQYSLQ